MKRTLKKIIYAKMPTFICIILILFFILIASGYGILKTRLNINGKVAIDEKNISEEWTPKVIFKKTHQMGDSVFFYDIIIYNDSNKSYQNWQIKINDTKYITYPYPIDGEREGNSWIITNFNWDDRLDSGDKLYATIIFEVGSDLPSSIEIEDYVQNFLNNSIQITAKDKSIRKGEIISNGNATLTLEQSEVKIENYSIQRDMEYSTDNPNERQYILTIDNTSNYDYLTIRANIYLGGENTMLEVTPSETTCVHGTNTTVKLPKWVSLPKGESAIVYFMITTADENFIPEIVLSATV